MPDVEPDAGDDAGVRSRTSSRIRALSVDVESTTVEFSVTMIKCERDPTVGK